MWISNAIYSVSRSVTTSVDESFRDHLIQLLCQNNQVRQSLTNPMDKLEVLTMLQHRHTRPY